MVERVVLAIGESDVDCQRRTEYGEQVRVGQTASGVLALSDFASSILRKTYHLVRQEHLT